MTIPDQSGRTILITGANSGIGRAAAEILAGAGATVVLSGRDRGRLDTAVSEVRGATGNERVDGLVMDVSSLRSVRAGAAEMLERFDRLDVLVNNAGVILSGRRLSEDGYEMTMATNHLGHFLLTNLLLDRLQAGGPSRVVNVASAAHRGARSVGLDDLQSERSYTDMAVYSRTKLANILFTVELARRTRGTNVSAFAVHPGTVRTGWGQDGDARGLTGLAIRAGRAFYVTPRVGAGSLVYAATEPGIESLSGAYLSRAVAGQFGPVREAR